MLVLKWPSSDITDINECASDPCNFGSTCINQVNSFTCNCAPGYGGPRCYGGEFFTVIFIFIHIT